MKKGLHAITILLGLVWCVNGLVCKVLDLVPRHGLIVERILGVELAPTLTKMIGLAEIVMAIWIWSGWKRKWNARLQIALVFTMNILEFTLAPDLLLWGPFNALWAICFALFVWYTQLYERRALCKIC